jgi:hypothetical protein
MTALTTLIWIWRGLLLAVVVLALVRKWVSRREDDTLHLSDFETKLVRQQTSVATTLNQVDRWGKFLTLTVLLFGVALVAGFVYMG